MPISRPCDSRRSESSDNALRHQRTSEESAIMRLWKRRRRRRLRGDVQSAQGPLELHPFRLEAGPRVSQTALQLTTSPEAPEPSSS
jgi:hypothetical protein